MSAPAPLHHKQRRETSVLVMLRCECGHGERWPIPPAARIGRCTCSRCGGQLHVHDEAPAIDSWRLR